MEADVNQVSINEIIRVVNDYLIALDVMHPGRERVRKALDELHRARGAVEAAQVKIERIAWHERVRLTREAAEAARAVGRERRRRKAEYADLLAARRAAGEEYMARLGGAKGELSPQWLNEHPIPSRDEYMAGAVWPYPEMLTSQNGGGRPDDMGRVP